MSQSDPRPYLWMLCGAFAFAVMAVLAEDLTRKPAPDADPRCDWQTVAVFRAALVAAFAAVLAWHAGAKLVWLRPWRLWVRSVSGSLSMVGAFYAFGHLHAEDVVTLSNTFPLWVALLSWPLYGHAPGWRTFAAILVGIAGVFLVEQPHLEAGNLGVFARWRAAGVHRGGDARAAPPPRHRPAGRWWSTSSLVATVFCLTAFLDDTPRSTAGARARTRVLARLLGIGVSATVGQVFLTLAFGRGAPAKVSVVVLMQIVFVMGLCVWAFDRG
jgi:drug/metabolite transporter (DMT)-like permease